MKQFGIIKKVLLLSVMLVLLASSLNVYASVPRTDIVYFYINVCKSCNEAQKAINQINTQATAYHPTVLMYDIESTKNLELLSRYYDYYRVPQKQRHLPCAFVGKVYLSGEDAIQSGLKAAITQMDSPTPMLNQSDSSGNGMRIPNGFQLGGAFLVGLVNGFNPCALSMLLFFISLLVAQKDNILKTGLAFCAGKFLMFLALGTILYNFLSTINPSVYSSIVKILLLVLILIVTALNISDFIVTRKEQYGKVKMQLPTALRKKVNVHVRHILEGRTGKYVIFVSFIIGAVITVGEFLCTGQLYLAAIVYNIRENRILNAQAFLALLIYDIGFVLPLLALVIAIQKGRLVFELSETLRSRLPMIKLMTAAVFLVYGVIFIFLF